MKIIGMVPVLNEEDIIQEVIQHLTSQGLELVVLDNCSTDDSYEICKKFLGNGIVELQQFKTDSFQSDKLHRMLYDMALRHSPNWVIRSDSDEILESGIKGLTLKAAIQKADNSGYNLIQFDRFDFFMTDDDENAKSIKDRLRYYSYHGDYVYRAWKYFPGIRIGDAAGHYPIFPDELDYKIFPNKFVLRHYTFRSEEQAKKKMRDRIRGIENIDKNQSKLDPHVRHVLQQDFSNRIDHKILSKYVEANEWNYTKKFIPFGTKKPPKRNEIFTQEGKLRDKLKTTYEYRLELIEKQQQLAKLRRRQGYLYRMKRFALNKFRKALGKKESEI